MIRVLPFLIELALLVYCLIDAIQSPEGEIRNLPKFGWIILIVILPLVGSIAWLVAGRPVGARPQQWAPGAGFPEPARPARDVSDIDARLDADLARLDREHEQQLRQWEAELREREGRLRDDEERS